MWKYVCAAVIGGIVLALVLAIVALATSGSNKKALADVQASVTDMEATLSTMGGNDVKQTLAGMQTTVKGMETTLSTLKGVQTSVKDVQATLATLTNGTGSLEVQGLTVHDDGVQVLDGGSVTLSKGGLNFTTANMGFGQNKTSKGGTEMGLVNLSAPSGTTQQTFIQFRHEGGTAGPQTTINNLVTPNQPASVTAVAALTRSPQGHLTLPPQARTRVWGGKA